MSLPMGMVEDQGEMMPAGIQIMADKRAESTLFGFGRYLEKLLGNDK